MKKAVSIAAFVLTLWVGSNLSMLGASPHTPVEWPEWLAQSVSNL